MKLVRAQLEYRRWSSMLVPLTWRRALLPDPAHSLDALDAVIRAVGVAAVLLLSLAGYGHDDLPPGLPAADPVAIAGLIILYNLAVITVAGVPWRRKPSFALFTFDWIVATIAVAITGGFFSPFLLLYYALGIGAGLRVGLSRSLLLVLLCASVYVGLSITYPESVVAIRLPLLVVQVTALLMVVLTAAWLRRVLEVEARRVEIEQRAFAQVRLLNDLTRTVLDASPDLQSVMRTVALTSSRAIDADSGMTVIFGEEFTVDQTAWLTVPGDAFIVTETGASPATLSESERSVLNDAILSRSPVLIDRTRYGHNEQQTGDFPGLEPGGRPMVTGICLPLIVAGQAIGALFVARGRPEPFSANETGLLEAIGGQMAVAVQLSRLYEMEREKAKRSEEREQNERDLLSMVSHELRTPLTSIKTCVGALEGLNKSDASAVIVDTTRTTLLQNIDRSTDRLTALVNELLDMARLRAGRVTLQVQDVHMGELINEIAGQLTPLTEAKGQKLDLDVPRAGTERWSGLVVSADRRRIEQVIVNLVSNANKYSKKGTTITLGATPRDGGVRVFVRDEGPGIAAADRDRIFDRYYQGVAGRAVGASGGTGLGLAIAKSIVDLHQGRFGLTSRPGQGSTFYFTLKTALDSGPAGPEQATLGRLL